VNLNHLAIFHAVVSEQSVSRAAERLLVSQPAISKQIRELERSLGVRLLDRLPRGVRPTEAGALLAGYAQRICAQAEDAGNALDELRGLRRGRLRVGASTTIGVYLLPELFVRFRQKFPGVQISLEIAPSDHLAARLAEGEIDLALTEGLIVHESLESAEFMQDELVAIAPAGHALARKRSVSMQQLCREPFVVRETGSGTQSLVERWLAERGMKVAPAMSLSNTEAIKRAVAAGVGVAIVSGMAVSLELQARRLALLRVSDLHIRRPVYRVVPRRTDQSHAVRALIAMLDQLPSTPPGQERGRN
jgi:DNA-binding transcriptional LysR family regulator